jgi:hypothetical protein
MKGLRDLSSIIKMNYFDDDDDFGYEHDIHMRVGLPGELDRPSDDPKDPLQRFSTFVNAIARSFNEYGYANLTQREIQEMLFKAQLIKYPEFKNPTAYVVGYYILQGNTINKKKLDNISAHFSKFEYPIRPHDAIRYANMWINELLM